METGIAWKILGIEPTEDEEKLKAQYHKLLVGVNPEDDPEGFKRLREAYETAVDAARHPLQEPIEEEEKDEIGQWLDKVGNAYWYLSSRNDPACWKKLLEDPVCIGLDTALEARERFLVFMMQHVYVSQEIWQLIDREFHIIGEREELEEKFPEEFLDYIKYQVENKNFVPYEKLEILGLDEAEIRIDSYLQAYFDIKTAVDRGELEGIHQKIDALKDYEVRHPYENVERLKVALLEKEPGKAVALAEKLLEDNRGDVYVEYWSGCAYRENERWEPAKDCWQRILDRYPENYNARAAMAGYRMHQGEYLEAKEMIMDLLEENGRDEDVLDMMRQLNEPLLQYYREEAEKNPEDKEPVIEACWCLFQNERFKEAIKTLEELHITEDEDAYYDYVNMMGRCYLGENQYEQAIPYLLKWEAARENLVDDGSEKYRKRRSREGFIKSAIGMAYYKLKDYEQAAGYLEEGTKLEADQAARHSFMDLLSQVYYENGQYQKCADACTAIIEEDPSYYPAYLRRQQVYFELQDGQNVVDDYYNAIRIFPAYYKPYLLAAKVFCIYRQYEDAKKVIEAAKEEGIHHESIQYMEIRIMRNLAATPEESEKVLELCETLRQELQEKQAAGDVTGEKTELQVFDEEMQKDGMAGEAVDMQDLMLEEVILYMDMDKEEKALELIAEVYKEPHVNYRFHWIRADILRDQKKYTEAIKEYKYLQKTVAENDEFIYNSGVCLYRMGEMEEAEKEFRLTLQKNPEHASAHHYLMEIYSRKYQQTEDIQYYKSALEEINAQLELVPDAYYYIERGLLYMDHYEFEPAIADYKKALELEPDNLYAYNNIGYALRIQGRYEEAVPYFKQAIERMEDEHTLLPFMNLARTYEAMQQWQDAIETLKQAAAEFGVERRVYLAMSDYYMVLGEVDRALKTLNIVQKKGLINENDYLEKKAKLYVIAGNKEKAIDAYQDLLAYGKAITGHEKDDWEMRAEVLEEWGLYLFYCRDLKPAIKILKQSMKIRVKQGLDFENTGTHLAVAYYLRKEYAKAAKIARQVMDVVSSEERYLSFVALAPVRMVYRAQLYMCLRDYTKMKELLQRVGSIPKCKHCTHTRCSEVMIVWGMYEEAQGHVQKALEYYREGLSYDPWDQELVLAIRNLDRHAEE